MNRVSTDDLCPGVLLDNQKTKPTCQKDDWSSVSFNSIGKTCKINMTSIKMIITPPFFFSCH
jgi:hypothetical protein